MLALALAVLPAGCKHISEIDEQLAAYEKRISSLEAAVAELRSQMDAVQKLLSGKFFVEDVAPLADGSGYRLVLSDSFNNITEYNVFNGLDPVISVRHDTDGNWYWTVNGEWLMVDGVKMRANGEAGATPVVKVQDGKWYVSFDGIGWVYAGDAVPGGAGIFTGIDVESDPRNVIFTLSDGSTFTAPKGSAALKLQVLFDDTPFTEIEAGGTASTRYEVIVPQGITYTFSSYEPEGWTVVIAQSGNDSGTITVSLPEDARTGKILFVLNGSDGSSYVRVVEVGVPFKEEYMVDSEGGTLVISGAGSLDTGEEASWFGVSGNTVTVLPNSGLDPRTAILYYTDAEGFRHTVAIIQAGADAPVDPLSGYGCILGNRTRAFVPGRDQLVRGSRSGRLFFAIVDPVAVESLTVWGFGEDASVGDVVNLAIEWHKGAKELFSSSLRMRVVEADGKKLRLSDREGNSVVIGL